MDTKVLALIAFLLATLAFYRMYTQACSVPEEDRSESDVSFYKYGMMITAVVAVVLGVLVYQSHASSSKPEYLTEPFDGCPPCPDPASA